MTNPGGSDEWWKQYGGEGVSPDSPAPNSGANPVTPPPAGYGAAPNLKKPQDAPPSAPQYPNYPPPQPNPAPAYPPPANSGGYPQPTSNPSAPAYGYGQPQPGYSQPGYPQQPAYGQPGYQPYGYGQPVMGTNGMAIASLIVSILGLSTMAFCFLPIGSLVGLILGVVALNQVKTTGQEGRGLALGGIWVGAGGLILGVLVWLAFGAAMLSGIGSS